MRKINFTIGEFMERCSFKNDTKMAVKYKIMYLDCCWKV